MAYSTITNSEIAVGAPITNSLMIKVRDNPEAIATGASGATRIVYGALNLSNDIVAGDIAAGAVGQSELAANSVGQSEVKTAYQTVSVAGAFIATGGVYVIGHTMKGDANANLLERRSGGSSTSFAARWTWSTGDPNNDLDDLRLYYINSSPPYDLGDGEVSGFIEARVDKNGNIKAMSISPDPAWAYNGPTDQTPSRYRKNPDGTYTPFIKRKDMSPVTRTLKQAMESGDPGALDEYMDCFCNAPDIEIELTPAMKNSDIDAVPCHLNPSQGEKLILIDPMSDLVRKIFEMRENHSQFDDAGFVRKYCTIGNTALKRSGPNGVTVVGMKMKNTRR